MEEALRGIVRELEGGLREVEQLLFTADVDAIPIGTFTRGPMTTPAMPASTCVAFFWVTMPKCAPS